MNTQNNPSGSWGPWEDLPGELVREVAFFCILSSRNQPLGNGGKRSWIHPARFKRHPVLTGFNMERTCSSWRTALSKPSFWKRIAVLLCRGSADALFAVERRSWKKLSFLLSSSFNTAQLALSLFDKAPISDAETWSFVNNQGGVDRVVRDILQAVARTRGEGSPSLSVVAVVEQGNTLFDVHVHPVLQRLDSHVLTAPVQAGKYIGQAESSVRRALHSSSNSILILTNVDECHMVERTNEYSEELMPVPRYSVRSAFQELLGNLETIVERRATSLTVVFPIQNRHSLAWLMTSFPTTIVTILSGKTSWFDRYRVFSSSGFPDPILCASSSKGMSLNQIKTCLREAAMKVIDEHMSSGTADKLKFPPPSAALLSTLSRFRKAPSPEPLLSGIELELSSSIRGLLLSQMDPLISSIIRALNSSDHQAQQVLRISCPRRNHACLALGPRIATAHVMSSLQASARFSQVTCAEEGSFSCFTDEKKFHRRVTEVLGGFVPRGALQIVSVVLNFDPSDGNDRRRRRERLDYSCGGSFSPENKNGSVATLLLSEMTHVQRVRIPDPERASRLLYSEGARLILVFCDLEFDNSFESETQLQLCNCRARRALTPKRLALPWFAANLCQAALERALFHRDPVQACVIDNFLTQNECDQLLSDESFSFAPATVNVGGGNRSLNSKSRMSLQCNVENATLTRQWLERLKECKAVPEFFMDHELSHINPRIHVLQYSHGGFFDEHRDGHYIEQSEANSDYDYKSISLVTVQLYLNKLSDANGGTTRFLDPFRPGCYTDIRPVAGRALVFEQSLLHCGMPFQQTVDCQNKTTIRLEIMYRPMSKNVPRFPISGVIGVSDM